MGFNIARYRGIEEKSYELEVVTPMFLGGSDPKKAELREPSFKGMLRFWWRATSGIGNIKQLYEKESEIFGNTEEKSKISIKLNFSDISKSKDLIKGKKFTVKSNNRTFPIDILHYLAYGALEYVKGSGNVVIKEYIPVGSKFVLSIRAPKNVILETDNALRYLLTFGGLGAKSRNGFGGMYCVDIQYLTNFEKTGDLKDYTSFSSMTKLIKFPECQKWEDALSDIGLAYKDARLSLENRHSFETRALIAKPIEVKGEQNIPEYAREKRHSKPYFLHVNKLPNGRYQGQILFLPYKFKPSDEKENYQKYINACNQMNQVIESKAGGNKWQ